ncbi:nitrilase-related carbon-nitrogen hydrolase [Sinorhizobium americanum]|uniref:nitrilase-related carbon-nitrogen hydrolase n=1 Tax=Sinorhizobium americanum TaxID=194963 RepID=UPI002E12AEC3|nr:nitrilase-related carbon-nitrogen hydrolase [Sinorhizobium americanum]
MHAHLRQIARRRLADHGMKLLGEAGSRGAHYSRFDPEDPAARQAWIDAAVPIDAAFVKGFRVAARRHGLAIVTTFLERGSPKPFNSAVLIDSRGDVVLHQRKRHICFFDTRKKPAPPARLPTWRGSGRRPERSPSAS